MRGRIVATLIWTLAVGCSSDAQLTTQCVDGDVRCGRDCSPTKACPDGLYCNASSVCAKDCVLGRTPCSGAGMCSAEGRCPSLPAPTAGMSGGSGGAAGASTPRAGAGAGGASAIGGAGAGSTCPITKVNPTRTMPTVILVVDQSGSMSEDFGGSGSRWNVLRDSLISQPSGLVSALQGQVSFGLALYSARAEDAGPIGMCPLITPVQPALNNRDNIAAVYGMAQPIDETPTGDSIDAVASQLVPMSFDPAATPYAFILATDGEPDSCADPNPDGDTRNNAAKQRVVDAVTRAYQRGIRTYVIGVGSDLSEDHQRAVANAGVGHVMGTPDAMFWRAGDDQTLRAALTAIVGTQISCDVTLNGAVQGDPCQGTVKLSGMSLGCNDANGWSLIDAGHIRLAGTACQRLTSEPQAALEIAFPCQVFVQ